MTTDKPTVHASLKALENDASPEPFVYMTKANKRVTFPDPMELDAFEAEKFIGLLNNSANSVVLKQWLSAKDFDAIAAEKLTLRQLTRLIDQVQKHYEGFFGSEGEGNASTAS